MPDEEVKDDGAKDAAADLAAKDEERLEREGHEKLLSEKDEALKKANARLEEFEKQQLEKADVQFKALPEIVRQGIEPLRDKMDVVGWVHLVEIQSEIASKLAKSDDDEGGNKGGLFFKPGDAGGGGKVGYETSPKAKEIMELIGKGEDGAKLLTAVNETDEDTGKRQVKFRRPVQKFIKGMNLVPVRRSEEKK